MCPLTFWRAHKWSTISTTFSKLTEKDTLLSNNERVTVSDQAKPSLPPPPPTTQPNFITDSKFRETSFIDCDRPFANGPLPFDHEQLLNRDSSESSFRSPLASSSESSFRSPLASSSESSFRSPLASSSESSFRSPLASSSESSFRSPLASSSESSFRSPLASSSFRSPLASSSFRSPLASSSFRSPLASSSESGHKRGLL